MCWKRLLIYSLCATNVFAQSGDKKGEVQRSLPAHLKPPAVPALSPEQALQTFKTAPGFKIELVASEPMVQDPVAITFDEDGRIWVVEMRGYMPALDGTGENAAIGRISVLEDTGGNERRSVVFL